jgi:hypothetical protein
MVHFLMDMYNLLALLTHSSLILNENWLDRRIFAAELAFISAV